jgi:asparagine synthase (glutamine-hydrolysing)
MCGINGFNFIDREILKEMNDSLKHRGPDAEGFFEDKKNQISLGHRRLSIIDLSTSGNQPMRYSHGGKKAVIVFNGEIYNFLEIRKELENKGYKFKSNSDTEVILASYLEWGKNCVKRFNGMWAFCIYDLQKKVLFLSRDRVGKKPIYYFYEGRKLIFSSEIKGILKHKIKSEINSDAVDLYFALGFIPSPYSIYRNIFKVEQRQSIIFDLKTKKLEKEFYYEWPEYSPSHNKKKLNEDFLKLMEDSTKKRMISDVPLGTFLSGGLDSSTVVNFAKKFNPKINTYSIGFEGKYDETPNIKILVDRFKTGHHHKYYSEKNFHEEIKNIFYYYDEPFSDPSMFPTMILSKFAREGLTVSLSGDGGDENFGGYPRYKIAKQLEFLRNIPAGLRKLFLKIPLTYKMKEGLKLSLMSKEKFYSEARSDFYKPNIVKKLFEEKLKSALKKTQGNLVEAIRRMDIEFYTLPDNFLTKVDRASMANSLEVRCPFLDYRILEYSMKIPSKFKANLFKDKILFREIIKKFLPRKIINQKKRGFNPPINKWISKKEYKENLKKILDELERDRILSKKWVDFYRKKIINKNSLVENNYKIRLLLFYEWYKLWIKRIQ